MKHTKLITTFLVATAFAVGCKPAEEKAAAQNREAMAAQIGEIKKETKEAAQELKDYTFAQKAQFIEKMEEQVTEINRDLDVLSAKIEASSDAVKTESKPKMQALREQASKLNKQLDEARNATESTWDSVKASFKKGYGEVKEGFQQSRQWVSDKIAP